MTQVAVLDTTKVVVNIGDEIVDFRGEKNIYLGVVKESRYNSSGKIRTRDGGVYYPSVFGLTLFDLVDPHADLEA